MSSPALTWPEGFRTVHERGVAAYRAGRRGDAALFTADEKAFLASIGCTPRELYDFIEDYCNDGAPTPQEAFEVAAVRRDYFLQVQGGTPSHHLISMDALPAKSDAVEGIRWLPRIIEKARAKLRGEMPADLMYGCGGDRPFLESVHFGLAEFLRLVWEAGDDTRRVVNEVVRRARR
jgi:hypothetical protein